MRGSPLCHQIPPPPLPPPPRPLSESSTLLRSFPRSVLARRIDLPPKNRNLSLVCKQEAGTVPISIEKKLL
ncbi:hypothetical protein OPV22_019689 [Ensete ventricosum]|uniref:Uncharacterized protein n=1 Tax=Ensete ventricosum TaxID=4639 RepID=A0AAV8QCN7_ENSVE|nr:hypothetical protein OPV22_019689 [Ensete ventricosum]